MNLHFWKSSAFASPVFLASLFLEEKEKVFTTLNAAQDIEIMEQNSSGLSQSLIYFLKGTSIAICPAKHRFSQMFNGY